MQHEAGFHLITHLQLINAIYCCMNMYFIGESCIEVETDAGGNDVTHSLHDDRPTPYLCTVCDERFMWKRDFDVHKLTHSRSIVGHIYQCTQCDKYFANRYYLNKHMNIHGSKYKCTKCGNGFRSSQEVARHSRVHSGEKPFECRVCKKRFTRAADLVKHGRIHSAEKAYNNGFNQSNGVQLRRCLVHYGNGAYKCLVCDKTFSLSESLKRHMRVHTGGTIQLFTI